MSLFSIAITFIWNGNDIDRELLCKIDKSGRTLLDYGLDDHFFL